MPATIQPPSKPDSDRCFFFRLPPELRIVIYEHVLRYEHGLTIEYDPDEKHLAIRFNKKASSTRAIRPNPLSLVCRRMEHETHGILTTANSEINIHCTGYSTPSSYILTRFMKHMSKTAIRRLRKVTICGTRNAEGETLSWDNVNSYFDGFMSFCEANPDTIVVLRFAKVGTIDPISWLPYCLAISRIIRYTDSAFVRGDRDRWMKYVWNQMGRAIVDMLHLPPNLRFSVLTKFPEHGIKLQIEEGTTVKKECRDMASARRMWEDGI